MQLRLMCCCVPSQHMKQVAVWLFAVHGDVSRPSAMTLREFSYAQSLTTAPVKGMLTGPVTMIQWSFVRIDVPRSTTAFQIALALRDEVADLEAAGCNIIQVRPMPPAVWRTPSSTSTHVHHVSCCAYLSFFRALPCAVHSLER